MTTEVSPRCHASERVVTVRVTLQELSPNPAANAVNAAISTEIDAVAPVRGRCSGTVGREQHLLAAVLTALSGFGQCAGHMINSG